MVYSIILGESPLWDFEMLVKAENPERAKKIAISKSPHIRHCMKKFGNNKLDYLKANPDPTMIL